MIKFNQDYEDMFLSVVRKYMQLRGGLSQKDLAIEINVGISTMSRFLNQKTKDLDSQLIAQIVAFLNIPLHEIIDFIEEESTQTFKKLVALYKDQGSADEKVEVVGEDGEISKLAEGLDERSTMKKTSASIRGVKMPFGEKEKSDGVTTIRDKLNSLSPRQKGFLTDFLDLEMENRDLIVDIGNSLLRYFKQGQVEF